MPPGHFYSPLPSSADVARALQQAQASTALDLRLDEQRKLLGELLELGMEVPDHTDRRWRYSPDNRMFGRADAIVYWGLLRQRAPRHLIEIGSGYTTALALDAVSRHLPDLRLTLIEPHPDRLLRLFRGGDAARVTLHRKAVQDIPLESFDALGPGDMLFIDSTHVTKAGSDVNWIVFHILPRIAAGVFVHFHDVFWPFEYPERWLREGRGWSEVYLLHAFLAYNAAFHVVLLESWLWTACEEFREAAPNAPGPSGLWLERAPD